MNCVLVVEDDEVLRAALLEVLDDAGYLALEAANAADARSILSTVRDIDVVLLNLGLPDVDGIELLRQERERGLTARVIILTARDRIASTVEGLETGASDYLIKPVRMPELLARIRLRLRERHALAGRNVLEYSGIRLSVRNRRVEVDGCVHNLTNREYEVLEVLLRCKGELVTRQQLFDSVWGRKSSCGLNNVNLRIRSLRTKLGDHRLQTVWGAGYRLQ